MDIFEQQNHYCHEGRFFSLIIRSLKSSTVIKMQLKTNVVNTRYLPNTLIILERELPTVLKTQCFNESNIPFRNEVKNTEIGHLFEHILLEYLCLEKFKSKTGKVIFNGRTKWNWIHNPYGSFEINIDSSQNDIMFFFPALEKTVSLTEKILSDNLIQPEYNETHTKSYLNDNETTLDFNSNL